MRWHRPPDGIWWCKASGGHTPHAVGRGGDLPVQHLIQTLPVPLSEATASCPRPLARCSAACWARPSRPGTHWGRPVLDAVGELVHAADSVDATLSVE